MSGRPVAGAGGIARAQFPAAFRWGCATSAFQIEGGAGEDGRGESIWDRFCAQPGRIRDGSNGAVACDHYHRWQDDLDLARDLGANAYRFSIAWPRVFPQGTGARPNEAGLAFYDRLVDGLCERGLEPFATLYHWDLPQALQERGGWLRRETIAAFVDYADAATRRLGDRVKHWATHNEPWCTAVLGHFEGVHAPGGRDLGVALQVCHHLLVSHGMALPVIRRNVAGAQAGIVLSLHPVRPATQDQADLEAVRRHDGLRNRWFLDPLYGRGYPQDTWQTLGRFAPRVEPGDLEAIAAPLDYLGVNYYFPETVAAAAGMLPIETRTVTLPGAEVTAFGWEVDPSGLVQLLARVHRDYRPSRIYVTENGATYDDVPGEDGRVTDTDRVRFLVRHVAALHRAIDAGVPLGGYFLWSLLDNFEWAEGYTRRFGIAHVDFATQQRRLKLSGEWYRDFLHGRTTTALP